MPAPLLRLVSHFAAARRNVANWRSGVDWASQILVLRVDLDDICHALRPPQYAVYSPRRHHSSGSVGSVGSVDRLSTRYAHTPADSAAAHSHPILPVRNQACSSAGPCGRRTMISAS